MSAKSMDLVWVVVKDLDTAVKFYTETVGLELVEFHKDFGWAELKGSNGGALLGLAQALSGTPFQPGDNAYLTFTVDDIEKAKGEMVLKGAKAKGEMQEIPGHVKLQMLVDDDENHFQIVQKLDVTH